MSAQPQINATLSHYHEPLAVVETALHGQELHITPIADAPLGARVEGIDLTAPLSPEQLLQLQRAFAHHQILVFKQQHLTDEQYLRFATYFGPIFRSEGDVPVLASSDEGATPDIVLVANIDGGYTGSGELSAHSDHHWTPYPSKASFLYALEVPVSGGDTYWSNQYQVYEELPAELKSRIAGLQLITYNPFVRRIKGGQHQLYRDPALPPISAAHPHPLVGTHPQTGRKFLYLDQATEVEIVGLANDEGAELIRQLREHANQNRYFYRHRWQVGDLVLWDNLATTHYRPAFDPASRRVLKRISLAGGRPF